MSHREMTIDLYFHESNGFTTENIIDRSIYLGKQPYSIIAILQNIQIREYTEHEELRDYFNIVQDYFEKILTREQSPNYEYINGKSISEFIYAKQLIYLLQFHYINMDQFRCVSSGIIAKLLLRDFMHVKGKIDLEKYAKREEPDLR